MVANVPLGSESYIRSNIDDSIKRGVEYLYSSEHFLDVESERGTNPLEVSIAKRIVDAQPHRGLARVLEDSWRLLRRNREWLWVQPLPGEPPLELRPSERLLIRAAMQDGENRRNLMHWNLWFMYALRPELSELHPRHMDRFLGRDLRDWFGYNLTHRWYAYQLLMASDNSAASSRWSIPLRSKLAALQIGLESMVDVLLCDLYFERVAFLLEAGESPPALSRWIERIIRGQKPDGGWATSRSPGCSLLSFVGRSCCRGPSHPHASLLATYALVQYRERIADALDSPESVQLVR